ncbi:MAG: hypothetical protein RAO75_08195 [Candidatus Chlorobium antarcticum]|jgi:hypothetical protein|nr:hypothetical protein [Candidatus Chlorobium antarcticum]
MVSRIPHSIFLKKWLKAFLLSPGVLFTAGYLLCYLAATISLNMGFKTALTRSLEKKSHSTLDFSVESLNAGPGLDRITLSTVRITPAGTDGARSTGTLCIASLEVPCPDLLFFALNREALESSAENLSGTILEQWERCQ